MAAFEVKQSAVMKKLPLRLLILVALALPTAAIAQRADPVYVEDRLNQLQQAISLLTGQIEQLQYKNNQLQQQLEKMQADYEFRLEQVEKGGGGARPGGAPARPPAPSTAAAPPAAGAAAAGAAGAADQVYNDAFKKLQGRPHRDDARRRDPGQPGESDQLPPAHLATVPACLPRTQERA